MTGVLIRRRKFGHRDTDTEGRWPCEDGGRIQSDAAPSPGRPQMTSVLAQAAVINTTDWGASTGVSFYTV